MAWWNDWNDFQNEWNSMGSRFNDFVDQTRDFLDSTRIPGDFNIPYQLEVWNDIKEDPQKVDDLAHSDYLARHAIEWYKSTKIYEDTKRWYNDFKRNTGQDWRNSKYPWMAYEDTPISRNNTGFADSVDAFEASASVIAGISRKLNRWWY